MKSELRKQLDKVSKLLALERDALDKGSTAEAANAAARAQEILLKYNLSKEQILEEKDAPVNSAIITLDKYGWNERLGTWIFTLSNTVAKANFCSSIVSGKCGNGVIYLIGKEQDREIALFMFESLINRLKVMYEYSWNTYEGREKRGAFRRGYYMGATVAIHNRLKATFQQAIQVTPETQALVLARNTEVTEYINNKFPNLGKAKKTSLISQDGWHNGHKDGSKIAFNKAVGYTELNQKQIS